MTERDPIFSFLEILGVVADCLGENASTEATGRSWSHQYFRNHSPAINQACHKPTFLEKHIINKYLEIK